MSVDNLNNQFSAIRSDSGSSTKIGSRFEFLNSASAPTADVSYAPIYQESGNYATAPNQIQALLDKNAIVQRVVTTIPNNKQPYVYYATKDIGAGTY